MGNAVSQQPSRPKKNTKKKVPNAQWRFEIRNGRVQAMHAVHKPSSTKSHSSNMWRAPNYTLRHNFSR